MPATPEIPLASVELPVATHGWTARRRRADAAADRGVKTAVVCAVTGLLLVLAVTILGEHDVDPTLRSVALVLGLATPPVLAVVVPRRTRSNAPKDPVIRIDRHGITTPLAGAELTVGFSSVSAWRLRRDLLTVDLAGGRLVLDARALEDTERNALTALLEEPPARPEPGGELVARWTRTGVDVRAATREAIAQLDRLELVRLRVQEWSVWIALALAFLGLVAATERWPLDAVTTTIVVGAGVAVRVNRRHRDDRLERGASELRIDDDGIIEHEADDAHRATIPWAAIARWRTAGAHVTIVTREGGASAIPTSAFLPGGFERLTESLEANVADGDDTD